MGSVMAARAQHSTATTAHGAYDADEYYGHGELLPGERVGPPLAGRGRKAMLRGATLILITLGLGGAWALLGDQQTWLGWLQAVTAAVSSSMDRKVSGPVERAASAMVTTSAPARLDPTKKPAALDPPPSASEPPASSKAASAPDAAARPSAPLTTAALPPAATGVDEPLRPPTADPADPYQMRAMAVGLHPDLSRVLLERLSPTDYRNAGIAIKTAVAETPDSAVFVFPRQCKPELALFQVRFVPGAAPGCRRYVVTVTKDGWLTTAMPMEKCGPQAALQRHK